MIGIDNIIAAILLSLIMLRRIEVRAAQPERNPHVPPEAFAEWRRTALTAYNRGAIACVLKVGLTVGWYFIVIHYGVQQPLYSVVPALVFVIWVITMVSTWKGATDARTLRERFGIVLGVSGPQPSVAGESGAGASNSAASDVVPPVETSADGAAGPDLPGPAGKESLAKP